MGLNVCDMIILVSAWPKTPVFGQKLEIRISKYETMTEIKNVPMTKTFNFQWFRFGHFVICYSNLFRISAIL